MPETKKTSAVVHMPTHIKERCGLAAIYAEDGAYGTAANILEKIAMEVRQHAIRNEKLLAAASIAGRRK